jgi:two-component system chemotaxis response regulator CheY
MLQKTQLNPDTKRRILIVDDSTMVLQFHAQIIREMGFDCDLAQNGSEALEQAMLRKYDAIIMDLNMPVMDGLELVRQVRALPEYRFTPLVVVTTENTPGLFQQTLVSGATHVLAKPLEGPELASFFSQMWAL